MCIHAVNPLNVTLCRRRGGATLAEVISTSYTTSCPCCGCVGTRKSTPTHSTSRFTKSRTKVILAGDQVARNVPRARRAGTPRAVAGGRGGLALEYLVGPPSRGLRDRVGSRSTTVWLGSLKFHALESDAPTATARPARTPGDKVRFESRTLHYHTPRPPSYVSNRLSRDTHPRNAWGAGFRGVVVRPFAKKAKAVQSRTVQQQSVVCG